MPPSSLLDDTAGILSSDSKPDIMTRQAVIKELEKQKTKIVIAQEQDITIKHVKSSVKRKSKFTSCNFRENGNNRKKFMRYNRNDHKREQLKENDKIRKKQMRDSLDDDKIGEFKKVDNKRKKRKNVTTLILMKRYC